jgi:glycosyltransferase involved in cell wall biosynthesis
VYTAHGWPFQKGAPWRQRLSSYAGEFVGARLGDAVICLTQAEADNARFVVPSRRLHVVSNGIADVADHRQPEQRSASIAAEGPALVMVARFAPPKRQFDLVESLASLGGERWTLTFIGDGPDRAACEELAAATFPDGRVRFAGHRDDVPAVLAAHDIALLWSGYEGMPMALLEGMRAGLCCIANDLPGVRSLFGSTGPGPTGSTESAGIVVRDAADLAGVVRSLSSSPAEIDKMGTRARQRYLDMFTADVMAAAIRDVYESIVR